MLINDYIIIYSDTSLSNELISVNRNNFLKREQMNNFKFKPYIIL